MTHDQKKQVVAVARSFLENFVATEKTSGHEARMIAVAEVCTMKRLPDETITMVMALVDPIQMTRYRFTEPGQKRWLSAEDQANSKSPERAASLVGGF